jgi:hypothetical protein
LASTNCGEQQVLGGYPVSEFRKRHDVRLQLGGAADPFKSFALPDVTDNDVDLGHRQTQRFFMQVS